MARCAVLSQQLFAASRILRNGLLCSHKRDYQDRRNASAAARLLASVTRVVPACNNVSIGRCARARIYKQAAAALRHAISRQKRVPPCTAAIECPPGIRNSIFERHAIHRRQPKRGRSNGSMEWRLFQIERYRLKADIQFIGKLADDTATEQENAGHENRALDDKHPFTDGGQ